MVSGHARVAQQKDPRKIKVFHQHKPAWSEVWENNPRIARKDEEGDFQFLYARPISTNMRPYHLEKRPDRWVYNLDYRPDIGELYFDEEEKRWSQRFNDDFVVVEPNIKAGASPNKQWGVHKWAHFAYIANNAGLKLVQMGLKNTSRLQASRFIETPSFRLACAVLSKAKAIVSGEGGLHHAAAALGIPGVVIFGGFTPVELTGYPMHRNLGVSLGDACGMRRPCRHCKNEMDKISPEQVLKHLKEVL
jgi:ADP-heptose:LPS heptosyltransferase